MNDPIAFIDLKAQRARLGAQIDKAVLDVIDHGQYILGPEVAELEAALADFSGAGACLTCASGTDALALVLMAKGVGPGQAVFVPAFTFVATAEVVAWLGATPVFVDVEEESFNMSAASLEAAIESCHALGLQPAGIIPVDLFGQPADYERLGSLAQQSSLWVLADAAQSFGAATEKARVGSFGHATATSFFPAKPLGCYGDGGAVFTEDADLLETMRSIRQHGQGADKYTNVRIGLNARMDTIQAAILLKKLAIFESELSARQRAADYYSNALQGFAEVPRLTSGSTSTWAQYTLRLPGGAAMRSSVEAVCRSAGVPTAIYYPIPLSRQEGYRRFPSAPGGVPVSESLSSCVLSLPMHPYLTEGVQDRVIEAVRAGIEAGYA